MFPKGNAVCLREGNVNFSGNDIRELVDMAELARKEGKTNSERYRVLMRLLHHVVKVVEDNKQKMREISRIARTQITSKGIFKPTQYERLVMQIDNLKSLLVKQPVIGKQLREVGPSMRAPAVDSDPCSAITELMAAQITPSEMDFKIVQEENKAEMDAALKRRRLMLRNSLKRYQEKQKQPSLAFRLEELRLDENVIALQQKVRKEVVESLNPEIILGGEFRPPPLVESQQRQREKASRRNRMKENKRKERARREFLQHVCTHHRKTFNVFHREQRRIARNLAKAVIRELQNRQKKKEEHEKSANSARLKALRENDEEKYMELLKEAKNERLMSLLKQTEEYMELIGATIQKEQARNKRMRENDGEGADFVDDVDNSAAPVNQSPKNHLDLRGTRKRYYNLAHKTKEKVLKQPKALVFGKLRSYQMAGLQWLVSLYNNNLNGILADEMGLGKTIQSISLLAYVMEHKGNNGPFLVIAPMSTLHNNWAYEMNRWVPSMQVIVYDGSKENRKKLREEDMAYGNYNALLTTFEFAMRDKKYLRKTKWQYIIVDEAHRLKNPKCKLVSDLNEYDKGARRIALSGTPLQNDLPELWSLLNFLHPSIFNSCDNFQQWFAAPLEKNLGAEGSTDVDMNEEEKLLVIDRLHNILRPFVLRREKREVESQLQDKVDVVLRCEMTSVQKVLYHAIKDGKVSMHNRMVQLRKICNHPYLFHPYCRGIPNSYRYMIDSDLIKVCSKFRMLDTILRKLKAKGHRVLLFNQMTKSMDIIGHYLEYRKYRYLRLDGTTAATTRAQNLKLFNAEDSPYFMFILSTKAGGLGLNLQTADTVILFDSDWNPQNDLQAQARAHRIGQRAKVISIRFVTVGTIEEKVLQTANNKRDVEAMVIQAGGFNKDYKVDESQKLVKSVLQRGEDDDVNRVSELDMINRSIARDDEEYAYYTAMDDKDRYNAAPPGKFPLWVWDFLANGSRANETRQDWATKQDAEEAGVKERRREFVFQDPMALLGKKRRSRTRPQYNYSDKIEEEEEEEEEEEDEEETAADTVQTSQKKNPNGKKRPRPDDDRNAALRNGSSSSSSSNEKRKKQSSSSKSSGNSSGNSDGAKTSSHGDIDEHEHQPSSSTDIVKSVENVDDKEEEGEGKSSGGPRSSSIRNSNRKSSSSSSSSSGSSSNLVGGSRSQKIETGLSSDSSKMVESGGDVEVIPTERGGGGGSGGDAKQVTVESGQSRSEGQLEATMGAEAERRRSKVAPAPTAAGPLVVENNDDQSDGEIDLLGDDNDSEGQERKSIPKTAASASGDASLNGGSKDDAENDNTTHVSAGAKRTMPSLEETAAKKAKLQ